MKYLLILLVALTCSCTNQTNPSLSQAKANIEKGKSFKAVQPEEYIEDKAQVFSSYDAVIGGHQALSQQVIKFDKMYYAVVVTADGYTSMVNLTKDQLEIELIQAQLKALN